MILNEPLKVQWQSLESQTGTDLVQLTQTGTDLVQLTQTGTELLGHRPEVSRQNVKLYDWMILAEGAEVNFI